MKKKNFLWLKLFKKEASLVATVYSNILIFAYVTESSGVNNKYVGVKAAEISDS